MRRLALIALLLAARPAFARDAGSLGLSAGGMLLLTVGGGVVTSVLLGQAVVPEQQVGVAPLAGGGAVAVWQGSF